MRIEVTKDHIDKGIPGSTARCMLAIAFQETLGKFIYVGCDHVYVHGSRRHDVRTYDLPLAAIHARRDFDSGVPVKPFSFEIDFDKPIKLPAVMKDLMPDYPVEAFVEEEEPELVEA